MTDKITIIGNVGNDPQKTSTKSGDSVIRFDVATNHRYFDKNTGTWVLKDTNWYSVSAFRQLAENASASISRGDPVIVIGRLIQRDWEANGKSGTNVDIEADTIALDLRRGTGSIQRVGRMSDAEAGSDSAGTNEESGWADSVAIDEAEVPF